MDKTKKRAFTIVELVIVIAVIAILAAVLIALFMNLIKKANKSADMQLIRNLNTALTTDAILNGKHTTMQSALDAAEKNGYILEKINATATQSEIIWDSKNDMFCYLNDDGTIEYLPEANIKYARNTEDSTTYISDKVNDIDYFVISSTISDIYSTYLYNYTGASTLEITKGLDVGKITTITSIKYSKPDKQSVIIRSNGGTLTIDAALSTVYHYGFAEVIDVNNVDNSACYHEGGRVGRLIYNDNEGKIFFESSAVVYCYMNTTSDTSANASDTTKAAGAIVYTYVDGGTNQAKGYVTENKEQVTVTNGRVEVSSCKNHNEDYDVVYVGNDVYLVCKCCGAFSKISSGASGTTTVTNSEGVNEGNNNTFSAENVEEIQDMIKDAVATIGYSKYYSTLEAAFTDAVDGDTIVMLKDVSTDNGTYGTSNYINISKTITLDLAGYGVTNNKSVGFFMPATATVGGVIFTIDDNSNNKTGYIISSKSHGIQVGSKNYIVVNNGRIEGIGSGIQASQYCSVTINDGVVKSNHTGNSYYAGIYSSHYDVSVTINGGTVIGKRAVWVGYNGDSLTVNGGTIDGTTYGVTASNGATVVVNDGTIKATGAVLANYGICVNGPTSSLTVNGGTITAKIKPVQASYATVNIAGGTFTATGYNAGANDSYVLLLYGTTTTITGGRFVNENAWTTNGKYQYGIFFANVQDANKVVTNGSLSVKDVDITATQTGIYFSTNAECIIKDCNITAMECIFLANSNAVCTVDGGNYNSNGSQVLYAQAGFFNVNNGIFTGSGSSNVEDHIYRYTLNCLDSSFNADPATAGFTVTGGSFYQFNPENDLSEGENTRFTPEGYHTEYNESTGYYTVVENN